MKPATDIAGEIAVQLLECELVRERLNRTPSKYLEKQLREAIVLARLGWARP